MKNQSIKNQNNQKEIWDRLSQNWKEFRTIPIKEVNEFLKNKKGKILDLGCGSGRNFVKSKDLEFYAVDFSKKMLKLAEKSSRERDINVKLKLCDVSIQALPYPDNFFDCAIFIATLHCIPNKEKRERALKELYRALKKQGQAIITVWSRNNKRIKNKPKQAKIPWTIEEKKYYRYYYIYEKEELENLLKKIGFKIINTKEDDNIVFIVKKI